jgi:large subunit ribosomal protein L24
MRLTAILFGNVKKEIGEISKKYANLPDEYIARTMEQVHWKTPRGKPQYLPRTVERRKWRFTTNRPWTGQFLMQNLPNTIRKKVFVEPIREYSFISTCKLCLNKVF